MNFASPYVYDDCAEADVYEAVSDEEFYAGMDISDSSSDEERDAVPTAGFCAMEGVPPPPPCPRATAADFPPAQVYECLEDVPVNRAASDGPNHPPQAPLPPLPPPRSRGSKPGKKHHWRSSSSSASSGPQIPHSKKRVFRRADTNVVTVRFDTLKTPSAMHAGEVVKCAGCEAILSHISKIEEDGPDKVWSCEFCGKRNIVDIEEEEKPSADDVTFLVEPSLSTTASGPSGRDESLVIFCVDISGSMCVTSEVPGYMKLRGGSNLRRVQRLNDTHEDQYLPGQRRDVTYISRLQAVQAAVDHQLGEMCREYPHRRVGLVAFNNEVTVIGDGTSEVVTVTGDKLKSIEELTRLGSELSSPKAVKETRDSLGEKVFGLEEGGPTALGPALVVALSMASHHPGSKVIVCTDGKANVGLGKLEDYQETPDSDQDPVEFYQNIAETANSKGVSVSVITIKGTDCKLVHLGKLAEKTGGQVNIVDPLKLREEFSNILADRIIATGVVATFILHRGLYINSESNTESKERREIGNVTMDTEISFEYGVRKRKRQQPPAEPPMTRISEVSTSMEVTPSLETTAPGPETTAPGPETTVPGPETTAPGPETTEAGDGEKAGAGTSSKPSEAAAGSSESGEKEADIIPSELPFQLQISYTDADGTKALRVLTQKRPVTRDRQLAEENADLSILGGHTTRLASELALRGEYTQSRGVALMNQRLAWRSTHSTRSAEDNKEKKAVYRRVVGKIMSVENVVQQKQQKERVTYGRTHSDDEDDEEGVVADSCARGSKSTSRSKKKHMKMKIRSEDVDDGMAEMLYQARSSASTAFRLSDSKK